MPKPKILCLHGYGTNANFMKKQSVSIQKILDKQVQFIFVDAPFQAPQNFVVDQKVIDLIQGHHRSWFPKINIHDLTQQFFQQFDKVRIAFQKASDHYDGILGFSQGAGIVHFLLKMKQAGLLNWKILNGIKFSLNFNGNYILNPLIKNFETQIETPSIHIISPQDFIFLKSIFLITQFKNPLVISHSYGHKFPKLGLNQSKLLISFIRKHSGFNQKKKENFEILSLSNL